MKSRSKLQQRLQTWWPTVAVLAFGCALSIGLWQTLEDRQVHTAQERLDQQAEMFSASVAQRFYAYGDIVHGMKAILEMKDVPAHDVFAASKLTQDPAFRYPGLEALSLIRRMDAMGYAAYRERLLREASAQQRVDESQMPAPSLAQTDYYIVDDVWPLSARRALRGIDAETHPSVKALIESLQNTAGPVMSAPLVMPETKNEATGVLISVPLRAAAAAGEQGQLTGVLNLSVNLERMMVHFLARGMLPHTLVSIEDVGVLPDGFPSSQAGQPIYASQGWDTLSHSTPRVKKAIVIWGRMWSLEFASNGSVLSDVERSFPTIIGTSTLGATLLLAAVVLLLSLQRLRAQIQAEAKHNLLSERTDRLKALFNQTAVGVAEIEPATGRYLSVNARFADVVGFSLEALDTMTIYERIHPDDRAECERLERLLTSGRLPNFVSTQRMLRADGGVIWAEIWVSPLLNAGGRAVGRHIVLLMDVTERRLLQEQLQAREAYSSEMLRYMPVGLVVVGPVGNIEFVNHQFEVMTGWEQCDVADESALWRHLCVDAQQHATLLQRLNIGRCEVVPTGMNMPAMEYLLRSKSGQELTMEVSGRFLGGRILLSFVDITQRKAAEAEIRWLGFYDNLTQLPNRRLLLDRLSEALTRSQRGQAGRGALLLLDIDNFKSLNETLGHQHGDALLRLVATRLSNCIAGRHTLARQGGDEFAVVLEDLPSDPLEAGRYTEQMGRSILEALRTPFYLGNQDFHVTVSMGAVMFCGPGDSVEELLKRADLALYQAKSAGRDTLQFFDPSMQKAVSARVEMEKDMRLALERHEFDLFFQPQVQRDKVIGAEALLRWKHPTKGFIPPGVFVPTAEESGLILPLGEWVLYAACRQLEHWSHNPALAELTTSVNVSPRQFYQPNFVEQVQQALQVTGAKPDLLELELTEGMLLTDVEDTIQKMVQLKTMGVMFSLDDFGTGYSSLSYLKRLPLDKLKIDQSFVREVVTSTNDAAIARSIIALGNSLGLQVIAEGVETEAQRVFMAKNGCSYWQGFYFSRPQPAADFEAWTLAYGAKGKTLSEAG